MTGTPASSGHATPAETAAAVLDAIEANPDAFSMSDWCRLPDGAPLPPDVAPPCGSTLCAAGWTAHLTGWTLVISDALVPVVIPLPDGTEAQGFAFEYAHRNGEFREIAHAANIALGLEPGHELWTAAPDVTLRRLRSIARR
ncbi:hypothetical protein [Streptomyces sp. SAS_275]|uniref:hypothetical protein n=1 Tax=Streptomyces sp. SAS_275 TaxID=3412746 RepID=UPI00403CD085